MLRVFRLFIIFANLISILFSSLSVPAWLGTDFSSCRFEYLEYPDCAVTDLSVTPLSDEDIKHRADEGIGEKENIGYGDVSGIIKSPYYTAQINGVCVPVYAAAVFTGKNKKGALNSFSEVYVNKGETVDLRLELTSKDFTIKNAVCLPESNGITPYCKNGVMRAQIKDFGIYSFLFNYLNQDFAFTFFVCENTDDDEKIASYISVYGEENVKVFDAGLHTFDYINVKNKNGYVVYLRKGAYLSANHKYDIKKEEDNEKYIEPEASGSNAIGLTRFPFINFYNCRDVKICGYGVIDLNHLDRNERLGVVFCRCGETELSGPKIINPPTWAVITDECENVKIDNTDIFGYRLNSDAYAICNSHNVSVERCYARSGDDLFDVKTLGGNMTSENIVFTNCAAWNGKARCFGICGEVEKDIKNITFKDCAVIYRDAVWDKDRIASLAIIDEVCGGRVENVTFENIEIFRDEGRAICCMIYDDGIRSTEISNITFKDIKYTSKLKSKVYSGDQSNRVSVNVNNVRANGVSASVLRFSAFTKDRYSDISYN